VNEEDPEREEGEGGAGRKRKEEARFVERQGDAAARHIEMMMNSIGVSGAGAECRKRRWRLCRRRGGGVVG